MLNPRARTRARMAIYKRRRRWFFFLLALVILLPFAVWKGWSFWNRPFTQGSEPADPTSPAPASSLKNFTVLMMGVDDRPGQGGRSDTMMLGFIDLEKDTVKLLSIPRDSYVQIPGHGWDKINAAYSEGQESLARKAVEQLVGVPVNFTAVVNMQGLEKAVDTVGGIDIYVDENMDYEDPSDDPPLSIHLKQGQQHLMGVDALHYVRFRHDARSDWGRMERQQKFLKAMLQRVKQPQNLAQLPKLLTVFQENVRTNLSLSQLTRIALVAKSSLSDASITSATLSGDDLWTEEGYYLGVHFLEMRQTVREMAGLTPTADSQAKDNADALAYAAALPKGTSTANAGQGGAVTATGTVTTTGTAAVTGTVGTPGSPGTVGTSAGSGAAPGTGAAGTGSKPSGSSAAGPTAPLWPLLVVDGSGSTRASTLELLQNNGFKITAVHHFEQTGETTIVWYSSTSDHTFEEGANRLKALFPTAKFLHLAPGPGDPPLKLILSQ